MDTGFEFDGCLHPGSGMAEALDAAGVDSRAPASGAEADAIGAGWNEGI